MQPEFQVEDEVVFQWEGPSRIVNLVNVATEPKVGVKVFKRPSSSGHVLRMHRSHRKVDQLDVIADVDVKSGQIGQSGERTGAAEFAAH
ncbi:hypothetical protein J7T55_001303 [Diaporthe amygdali]|uniref:uncharacterized protein n=1 Tax=Phomopsis amygdali TaxID=1214568 RepID=UPI0022FEEC92|nr:uncharacterized protein J7T55_001303 [Diaporthe amygdali]KAJ0106779.1 hypothetical protein J7T55_001303 [Diaporthe amygdali]